MPRRKRDESAHSPPPGGRSPSATAAPLDRFTPRARRVLAGSVDEARRLCHPCIGPEHFIRAMLQDETATGTLALRRLGGDPVALLAEVARVFPARPEPLAAEPVIGEVAQRIISRVLRATSGTSALVGTNELFKAVLRDGALETVLGPLGIKPWRIIDPHMSRRLLRYQDVAAGPRENVITLRVADEDATAVDSLVEVGIMRTRSEAAAWLLHAGIGANQALFEKVRGLMEEIRGLRDEAQRVAQEHTSQPDAGSSSA